jgi:hypothetical protein
MQQFRSFPASLLHAWRGQIATLSLRSGGRYRVLHHQATLFPRFAAYYAQLRALPKAARRQLQWRWARSLAGVALLFALGHGSAQAAEFTAGNAAQLNAAITMANSTLAADTITLTQDIVLTTPADVATDGNTGTVVVTSSITLEGQGHTLSRAQGAAEFRLLRVARVGDLTVRQTTLHGGKVSGQQAGGGVLNEGSVTLEECTISGNSAFRGGGVWSATSDTGQLTLSHSTISGNSASSQGGGVGSNAFGASQVTITSSTISDNSAERGGGVYGFTTDDSQMTLTNSTISDNSATSRSGGMESLTYGGSRIEIISSTISGNSAEKGGGIASYTYGDSRIEITTSTISGNSARSGGGMYSRTSADGGMTLLSSTLSGNSAASYGGGVSSRTSGTSDMTFALSTISGNSATFGGGIYSHTFDTSDMTIILSTLSGNSAASLGGGVENRTYDSSEVTFALSTISGNTAQSDGGGIFSGTSDASHVKFVQMLVAGNSAPSGAEAAHVYDLGGTLTADAFNLFGHSGLTTAAALDGVHRGPTDLLATSDSGSPFALSAILDPTLANNGGPTRTHNLVLGSPAIDAGGFCAFGFDQRGAPSPQGSACDIGAVEFGEVCGNCVDDDGDGLVDFADPDCTTEAAPITKERASFSLSPAPRRDQLTLTATLPGGQGVNPPQDGLGVQFLDDSGSLLCVHLPPASVAPSAWKTKLSAGNPTTTWQFKDAPNGSLGDPSKDAGTVSFDPIKDTLTVKLTIKQTEIGGDATARNITTGIGSGVSRWQKLQRWTAKAGGKKLGTP